MRFLIWIFLIASLTSIKAEDSLQSIDGHKVVLITGGARGIGLAAAECLAQTGYVVYATFREKNKTPSSAYKTLHFIYLDVKDTDSIKKAVDEIVQNEGHLDILINNAGYALAGSLESLSMEEIQEQMDVNFYGIVRTCQQILPQMRKQKKGHIINISSEQGVYGLPYGSLYTASKAAVESLSEALALEVLPWNIAVSIVEPGAVTTNFSVKLGTRAIEGSPYEGIHQIIQNSLQEKRIPSEFCQSPEEIAQFLQKVIEDPQPKLRYQTSKQVEETVAKSIQDLSGMDYLSRMKSLILEFYQEAWVSD